ncbi:hypothetical protein MOUN0_I04786 [Monosporozyma unispora]
MIVSKGRISMECFIYVILFISLLFSNQILALPDVEQQNNRLSPRDTPSLQFNGPFTTVIDLLSQDVEFSIFVRLLQRKKLIPYLNELQNFTLLAPVNSAFVQDFNPLSNDVKDVISTLDLSPWDEFDVQNYIIHDNVITTDQLTNSTKVISDNVKFPLVLSQPNINSHRFVINNDIPIVEPNLSPNMQNATVHGVLKLVTDAKDINSLINSVENIKVSYTNIDVLLQNLLNRYMDPPTNNKTLLVPSNKSFKTHFNSIELNYLLNHYNKLEKMNKHIQKGWYKDMEILLNNLLIDEVVGGSTDLLTFNQNNGLVHISSKNCGQQLILNERDSSILTFTNQPYDFGMAHFFDDIQFLNTSISFNAEKYLHGLNCSGFVREIYFRGLEKFIKDNDEFVTIFLPQASLNDEVGFTKSTLLYHFTELPIWLEKDFPTLSKNEIHNKFYNSSFCSSNKKLGGHCQRMKLTKSNKGYFINNKFHILNSKPYQIGNTLIYIIDNDITLPNDLIFSLPPTLDSCSKSISFLRKLNYLDLKPNHEGYTVFLPCFNSWDDMGLNFKYIQSNFTAASLIMENLIVNGLYYTDLGDHRYIETNNLLDEPITIDINKDDHSSKIEVNIDSLQDNLTIDKDSDIIFNQGVIHPTHNIEYPLDLQISLKDLFMTTGNDKFMYLLETLPNYKHLFNDSNMPYSILVPTLSSLDYSNISNDYTKLEEFLKLHIIPGNETVNILNCDNDFNTLLGEILECKSYSQDDQYIKVKEGATNEVRILNKGCSTENSQQACIFLIDKPLSLNWIGKDKYNLNMPILAVAFGIILGVVMFMIFVCCLLVARVTKIKNRYQMVDSSENSNENDNTVRHINDVKHPLLNNSQIRPPTSYDSTNTAAKLSASSNGSSSNSNNRPNTGSASYSVNSTATPIQMPRKK